MNESNALVSECVSAIPHEKTYVAICCRKVLGGTSYDSRTPDTLCSILNGLQITRERVVLVYGNVKTGEAWQDATPNRGRIGRSTGSIKIPLLIRTSRSTGGESILDHCILEVRMSAGGRVLWSYRSGK